MNGPGEPLSGPSPDARSPYASQAVRAILDGFQTGTLKRSWVEDAVLKLAAWRDFSGLGCICGTMGFPGPGMLGAQDEHTADERAAAWHRDVLKASDQLLAEAWCQLWSRDPPAKLGAVTPPGLGLRRGK